MGAAGWLVPGAGHLLQGRWWRGLLLGGTVYAMFLLGMGFGGHLFDFQDTGSGLLAQVFSLFNWGAGALYGLCWVARIGFTERAELATFEYGNTFLLLAGLVNYLAMLDAFDIRAGRKP
jgi:hypothetical protein